jgi:hypothetical protein
LISEPKKNSSLAQQTSFIITRKKEQKEKEDVGFRSSVVPSERGPFKQQV